jgi:restriction endonuclease S subunit
MYYYWKMMKVKIKNIAEISSGYNFSKKVENDNFGNCRYIQLRDVDDSCTLDIDNLMKVNIKNIKQDSYIRKNDILFKSKSNNNIACVISEDFDKLVASAHYFIIRAKRDIVLPEYLAWYINQKPAQRYFELHSAGSTVSVVTKKILSALNVTILPIEKQKLVVELAKLRKKERGFEERITELKAKLFKQKILTLIK